MGRRKGSKNKKKTTRAYTKHDKKTIGSDFIGGFLIVLAFILFTFYKMQNIGIIADTINKVSIGLFGISRYVLPVVFAYTGIYLIVATKKVKWLFEILKGLLVIIFFAATVYAFNESKLNLDFLYKPTKFIGYAYTSNISGVLGAVLGYLTVKLLGLITAKALLIMFTLFLFLYYIKLGLRDFIAVIYNIFVTIIEFFANMFIHIFGKNEEQIKLKEIKKQAKIDKKAHKKEEISKRLASIGNRNYADNIKDDDDQVKINLDTEEAKTKAQKQKEQRDDFFKKQREEAEDKNVKEVLQLDHSKHEDDMSTYIFPPLSLLQDAKSSTRQVTKKQINIIADKLEHTLLSFGVDARVTNVTKGPTVVRYELTPKEGVKVSNIVNLSDDIALNLAAKSIRIEAPIPGKNAVGIELPNEIKENVYIKDVISSHDFKYADSKLAFALGKNTAGDIMLGDVSKMPHVLVAGATGSGKSVCINSILVSILYKAKPNEVKMMLIDPKMVELSGYNGIPHLLIPVVTDPKKAAGALNWAVSEMVDRYSKFAAKGVKDIIGYNKVMEEEEERKLPQIVIVIDELSDLMMASKKEVEDAICRLAQMARAAGMYLIIATQRPSVDVITGLIKANIPSRIAFTVSSQVDSRTIIDKAGAEQLLGKGDMLFYPTGQLKPERIQGAFVSESEVENIVTFIKGNHQVVYNEDIIEKIEKEGKVDKDISEDSKIDEADPFLEQAIDMIVDMGVASASYIQRRFKVGSARAGRIIDQMEERCIVSGYNGSKPREVLISKEEWQELKMGKVRRTENINEDYSESEIENKGE